MGLLWESWDYIARNRGRLLKLRCHRDGWHLRSSIAEDGDGLLRLRCPRNGWPLRSSAAVPTLWQCYRVLIHDGICPTCSFCLVVCGSLLLLSNLFGFEAHAFCLGLETHTVGLEPFSLLPFSELIVSHQVRERPLVGVSGLGTEDRLFGAGVAEEVVLRRLLFFPRNSLGCFSFSFFP